MFSLAKLLQKKVLTASNTSRNRDEIHFEVFEV